MQATEDQRHAIVGSKKRSASVLPKHKRVQQVSHVPTGVRSGTATGTTPHFKMWQADLALKSALQRTKTAALADTVEEPKAAAAYAICATHRLFRNVWAVTQADRETLLALPGMGPARLTALHADLLSHRVQPKWTA